LFWSHEGADYIQPTGFDLDIARRTGDVVEGVLFAVPDIGQEGDQSCVVGAEKGPEFGYRTRKGRHEDSFVFARFGVLVGMVGRGGVELLREALPRHAIRTEIELLLLSNTSKELVAYVESC